MSQQFFKDGLRFSCTGCGGCCHGRGKYENVYVDRAERRAIARFLGISAHAFTRRYTEKTHGFRRMIFSKGACPLLEKHRCSVYPVRPDQCRTWPFWPENMNKRVWEKEIVRMCPGAGRGRLYRPEEIEKKLGLD